MRVEGDSSEGMAVVFGIQRRMQKAAVGLVERRDCIYVQAPIQV